MNSTAQCRTTTSAITPLMWTSAFVLSSGSASTPGVAPAGAEIFDVPLTAEVYAAAPSIAQLAVLDEAGGPAELDRVDVVAPLGGGAGVRTRRPVIGRRSWPGP